MKPLKPTNTENSEFKLLFSTTKMSPMVKLAIVSVDSNMIPKYIAIVIFILSQIQIMSIFLKTGLECYSNSSLALSKSFTTIHNAISVGDALDFTGSFHLSVFIIALAYSYLLAGVILLTYLLRDMYRGKTHSKVAQRIWGTGAYLHVLLFFYPIHSISLKAISVSFAQDEQQVFRSQQAWTFIQVSACMALIANLFFAIVVLIYLLPPVKTGFALSTKTKKFSILDISLKFILPLIWMLDFKSKSLNIFLIVVNFIFCLLRDGLFFRILPHYDTRVLRVAAKVHAAQTLFALVIVIAEGLSKAHFYESLLVVLTLWVMVVPIIVKSYSSCMESIFRRILFTASGSINPYYLAHYWLIYKDLAKNRTELKIEAKKCDKNYLYYQTALDKIIHKSITTSRREEDLYWSRVILQNKDDIFASENCVLSLGINFLRGSLQKNPLSILQRLSLASLYIKYQHSYQTANQIIQQGLERSPSFTKSVSFSLILLKLIRKLRLVKASSGSSEGKGMAKANISIEEYLSLHQKFEKIKEDIQHQLEPQIKFWKNFQLAHIDLDSFLHLAKLTSERSKRVFRYIKNHRDFVGHNFVEPILTLGLYLSFVQHDSSGGSKLMKEYDLRKTKPKDHHKDGVDNDMLHSDSMYFVVSASFHDLGKILNYSNNANQIFSIHKEAIVGKSINVLAPNIYRNDYDHILGVSLKEDIFVSLCKPREIPVLDRHGNLVLCWISITLEFLPKTGLSYCILLRPADVSNRVLLIKQNGVIMHSSEQFTEDMGIVKTDKKDALNIFTFCPQLAVLTRAFQHMSTTKDSLKKLDRGERKTQEGNTSSITETIEKEEMKDTINGKDNDFQRLCEKFTNGENLIFSPSTTKKREISPSIAGIDDDLSAMPVVYKTIIQTHNVGNEKIYEVKLQQMLNANVAVVWANQDPALKGQGLKTFASFQMIANTLNSLKNKVRSPFSGFSAKYGKQSKNLLTKASIYGEDVQSEAEEKGEFKRAVLVTKTETTPNILLNSMANSCDLRESDQELAANEPLYKHDGAQANGEAEEDTIDEELKMKIIKLGIFKRHNKNKGKLFDTVKEAQNHRSLFKIASDILINFKGPNLKKILEGMNQNNNPAPIDDASSVSGKSRVQRAEKTIQRILQSRNYSKYSICYLIYFLLTKVGLLLTVFWFSFDTLIVSNRVKTVSEALQNIYMRGFWINLANQETRIWSGVRGGIVDPNWSEGFIDIAIETRTTNTTFHKMDQFNNQLYQAIASMDDETQLLFATKNVRIYDRDDNNNLVLIGIENTFQTTSRILTEGFINVYMPYPTEIIEDFITSEARFIFDNSHNDLLIVSENLIQFLTDKMDAAFSGSESMNLGIFWAGLVVSFLFVAVSVGYIIMLNRDYHVFANILLTFPQEDALQTEVILNAFKEMLEKDYEGIDCIEAIEASQMHQQAKVKSMDHSNMVKKGAKAKSSKTGTSHRISIAVLKRKNFFLLLRMLLIVAFIAGALLFYYYWSLDRIKTMQKQQVIINSSLDYINLQSRISVELQSLVQDNDTSYIRNQPLLTSLNNDMERLTEITVLEDSFRDVSGELPALQLEILSGYNCDDVTTDLYLLSPGSAEEECADLAAGTNVIGLVEIITKMRFQMTVLLEQFFSSPRTSDDLKVIYLDVINDFIEFLDVSITMFLMSYSLTLIEFQDLVQTLTENGRILATVGVLISIAIGAWSLFSIILPLMKKEFDKKVVLSIVPTPMILSNRHVKTYVVRNANLKVREAQYLLR